MYKKSLTYLCSIPKHHLKRFLDSFDTVVVDCDGVLWIMGQAIPGSSDALNKLRELGKNVFYVTNNSTKTRDQFVEFGSKMDFIIKKKEVISSAYLTACYLKSIDFQGKAYIVGSEGLSEELSNAGIKNFGVGPDPVESMSEALNFEVDPEVKAVIVGMDRHISYKKMLKAATYLNDPNIIFIGTNTDERFPVSSTKVMPGTGALVRSIECCSSRNAVIMGKPSTYIAKVLADDYGIDAERTLVIGDRCNTDIQLGTRCGFQTLLVLTGVTDLNEVRKYKQSDKEEEKEFVPDFYLKSLSELLECLPEM